MALNMNTGTLTEGPEGSDDIIKNVYRTAGILRLVTSERITTKGQSFPILPRTNVEEVGETDLKPYTDAAITSLVAKPITLATTLGVSKQLIGNTPGIIKAAAEQGGSDIGQKLDEKVTGTNGVTVTGSNFGQLKNVPTSVQLSGKAAWYGALATLAGQGSIATGVFLSTAYWAELSGTQNDLGVDVYKFSPDSDINSGVINGVPYSTFLSAERVAYLGDFKGKAKAGTVYETEVDVNPYGGSGEGANFKNFWSRNMIGVRIETEVAFNFYPDGFVKLIPVPAAPVA